MYIDEYGCPDHIDGSKFWVHMKQYKSQETQLHVLYTGMPEQSRIRKLGCYVRSNKEAHLASCKVSYTKLSAA
jgi:hypothetical protein